MVHEKMGESGGEEQREMGGGEPWRRGETWRREVSK